MHSKASKIISTDIILSRGNRTRKIKEQLSYELRDFKTIKSDRDFLEIFDDLSNKRSTLRYINDNLLPRYAERIGKCFEIGYCGDIDVEMRWQFCVIGKNSTDLNGILSKKREIDRYILLNQYEEAINVLESIQKEYGYSLWLLESKIFLYQRIGKNVETEIVEPVNDGFLSTLMRFWVMRSSDEVSTRDYVYFTSRELSKFRKIHPESTALAAFYEYIVAPFIFQFTEEKIGYILRYISNMPLIDRYLCMVDICEYLLISSSNISLRHTIEKYIVWLQEIEDPTTRVISFLTASPEKRREILPEDILWEAKRFYIEGNLEKCICSAEKVMSDDIKAIDLYVEASQLLGRAGSPPDISDNIKLIIRSLNVIYSIGEDYEEALESTHKLIYSCVHAVWARDLYNNLLKNSLPYQSDLYLEAVKFVNMQRLTIETICENLPTTEALDYLNTLNSEEKYVLFWKHLLEQNYAKASNLCGIDALSNLLFLKSQNAFEAFQTVIDKSDVTPIFKVRYSRLLWDNVSENHEIERGIDYFIKQYIRQEYYAEFAPVSKFMDYLKRNTDLDRGNIRVPILYYISVNDLGTSGTEELTIAGENFFYENNIERPSKLQLNNESCSLEELVFFLRYVCTTQIMGPILLEIQNSRDLDLERIEICRYLKQIDPENEEIYDQEIRDITQKLYIYEGLDTIENSKIYVNTDGVKGKIIKNLKSDFNNYMFYRKHRIGNVLPLIQKLENSDQFQIISLDASKIFREIVLTIRDEFVSSGDYGLDGYLSLNIRHGTLAAHLRAPLTQYQLFAPYNLETGEYDVNSRWLNRIKNKEDREIVTAAIIAFNQETDQIVKNLKENLIQVSTEEKKTAGVFDYTMSETQLNILQTYLKEDSQLEDLVDYVFDYLWIVTEKNLEKMQHIIQEEVSQKYSDEFSKLTGVYRELGQKDDFPEAFRRLKEAHERMDEELEKVCHWFKRSAMSKHEDFSLEQAFQIGFRMIENVHPEKKFSVSKLDAGSEIKLEGDFLKNYVDIFYTLFDNVSLYAKAIENVIYIECNLIVDEEVICIEMSNDCDCSRYMEKGRRRLDAELEQIANTSYLSTVKKEGGTGIPKIHKILYVDLGWEPFFSYKYQEEWDRFSIKIEGRRRR